MEIQELLKEYKKYAIQLFEPWPGIDKNEEYKKRHAEAQEKMESLSAVLAAPENIHHLEPLLEDEDKAVQLAVALDLMNSKTNIEKAVLVLERLQYEFGPMGSTAMIYLREYKKEKGIFLRDEEVKAVIREAFKDVVKGNGISIREANAIDDYASPEELAKAREEDVEEHWWDLVGHNSGAALSFTDIEGFRFLAPATMTDDINEGGSGGMGVIFFLGMRDCTQREPVARVGSKAEVSFLKTVSAKKNADYYKFTQQQIHAIALFFLWDMQQDNSYLLADRDQQIELLKSKVERNEASTNPKENELTLEDEIAIWNEECRIMRDWLKLGGVDIPKIETQ
jgi:hypothetical protein